MNQQWHFRPTHPGDDITDPITGEFFADGSLENPATALVREAIQNALDAARAPAGDSQVRVRFGLFNGIRALPADAADRWFGSLWSHLAARGNGLRDVPRRREPCDYLVIEDFGTSGLTGDIASDAADGERNNFVDFLRSDGRTRKAAGDRGSWGVGKNVFPRSSRINAFIAYTVRHDDGRRLIMGKSILKIRRVDGQQFQPACYLGESWEPRKVPRPFEDPRQEARLRADFDIERDGHPGLSIVIPWPDTEIRFDDIFRAVVTQFYYAILDKRLEVSLVDNGKVLRLSQSTLPLLVQERLPDIADAVKLAHWSLTAAERIKLAPPPPLRPQKWGPELVPDEIRAAIAQKLTVGERVAIRVQVHVRPARLADPQLSFFDIYLEHHDGDRTIAPSFFREQLAISSVKRAVGVPRIRALVVIEDKPLAELLRAAEPPNHTDWDIKTANFRNVYRDGNHVVTFVKSAVKQLMGYVRAGDETPDPTVAIDFFAIADLDDDAVPAGKKTQSRTGDSAPPHFTGTDSRPRAFSIRRVESGFAVSRSDRTAVLPSVLYVAVAYDVLFGSPWKQFEPADFDFTRRGLTGLEVQTTGDVAWTANSPNSLRLRLGGGDFELRVTGFDPNRDLITRVYNPRERIDADTPPELYESQEA